ncbi:MAG: hypothetical protein MR797_05630 [Lachnospiraceae bacterium]|nr:hypothetical protein [Lachnospiraceae bacterium]
MLDKELCKKCCHWYDPGNHCDSTEEFCINNDHFSPKTFSITELMSKPKIENVIFNNPATIVFWQDGSKTVVKCHDSVFDPEKGLAMAISKKALGNKYDYYDEFEKWLPKEKEINRIESPLQRLVDVLSSTDFPSCDVTPNTEDIPSCTDCEYCSTEMYKQPCKDCLNNTSRPGFKKVTEEIEDRLCSKCVHKGLKYTEEPCTSCFYDYTRPNFEKAEDK